MIHMNEYDYMKINKNKLIFKLLKKKISVMNWMFDFFLRYEKIKF